MHPCISAICRLVDSQRLGPSLKPVGDVKGEQGNISKFDKLVQETW